MRRGGAREIDVVGVIDRFAALVHQRQAWTRSELPPAELRQLLRGAVADQGEYCDEAGLARLVPELEKLALLRSPEMLANLLLPECAESNIEVPALPPFFSEHRVPSADWPRRISETLRRGRSPVALSYCSNFLLQPDHVGVTDRRDPARPQVTADWYLHGSIVVGQKPIGGQCHCLIRNSHGRWLRPGDHELALPLPASAHGGLRRRLPEEHPRRRPVLRRRVLGRRRPPRAEYARAVVVRVAASAKLTGYGSCAIRG